MGVFDILWILFVLSTLQPLLQQRMLLAQRAKAIRRLERERGSRVITLIHRQEAFSFFGLPFRRFIDVDDSEEVLRAIELTDPTVPIDLVLHTPGGLVLAAEQIAMALLRHKAKVTVMVPHYAMSGGTLLALAADEILMSPSAVLGPVDPQVGQWPAASILAAVERKDPNELDDETLILADVSRKAQRQVRELVVALLEGNGYAAAEAARIAETLVSGQWTHDYPITVERAREIGLRVSTDLPDAVRLMMRLFPQPRGRRPSVEYVPVPYRAPREPAGRRGAPAR
jgi:ClpP class serine protease